VEVEHVRNLHTHRLGEGVEGVNGFIFVERFGGVPRLAARHSTARAAESFQ
jgi:hypothetical protein